MNKKMDNSSSGQYTGQGYSIDWRLVEEEVGGGRSLGKEGVVMRWPAEVETLKVMMMIVLLFHYASQNNLRKTDLYSFTLRLSFIQMIVVS